MTSTPRTRLAVPDEVRSFRARFPIFERSVHLANNSKGALSDVAIAAHQEYLDSWRNLGAPWDVWVAKHEELRQSFATLIGAQPHEIAICPSVSSALASIASALDWRDRDGVVLDDFSFPSVAYLWHAQSVRGARVLRVHPDDRGEIEPEYFQDKVDATTRLVSVAHVCYKNGHRLSVPAVAQLAHDAGAWLAVDDYQSCGSRELDVRASEVDILTTGTVKFLLGSAGVGLMYVREELLEQLHPAVTGWFGQRNPDDFQIERHDEAPDAARFQSGTPAIPAIYDSLAGIELIRTIGLAAIGDWIDQLTAYALDSLVDEGFVPATPREPSKRGPQVAVRANDMTRAVSELAARGVITTHRDGNVRAAFHYYNTPDDIDAFVAALVELGQLMVRT